MPVIQGQVGSQNIGDGTYPNIRMDKTGALIGTDLNPKYYENVYRNLVFFGANTAGQALSVASATYTGLAVANPTGSGKNLIIIDVQFAITVTQTGVGAVVLGTAATVALTTGSSSGPSGSTCLVGSGVASVAKVGASATLGAAPTIMRALSGAIWVTGNTGTGLLSIKDEVAGLIVLAPGQLVCVEAITTAVTGITSMTWLELPI